MALPRLEMFPHREVRAGPGWRTGGMAALVALLPPALNLQLTGAFILGVRRPLAERRPARASLEQSPMSLGPRHAH